MKTELEKLAQVAIDRNLEWKPIAQAYLNELHRTAMLEDTVVYLIEDYTGVDLAPEAEIPKDIQSAIDCLPDDKKPS